MEKSLHKIAPRFSPYKLIFVVFIFIVHSSIFINHCSAQWYRQTVPVTNSITGIEFVDSLRGWACTDWNAGNTGYILATTNGGINWTVQFSLGGNRFTALDMIDVNTGYAAGWNLTPGNAFVYKTTNGGINWFDLNAPIGVDADDIFFVNATSGYLCADFSINVYKTTNAGLNWILSNAGITQHPTRLYFLNYNTGYCGADFVLYKTTNAGANWTQISSFTESVHSIYFLNTNTGWLGLSGGKIALTSDGGSNWNIQQPLPTVSNSVNDIIIFNQVGYAALGSVYVYKTVNAGQNWGYQIDTTSPNYLAFVDSSKGWSAGFGISRTINGGGTISGVEQISSEVPEEFYLFQNYPNPFNPSTKIKFEVKVKTFITLKIFDVLGREIEVLVNQFLTAGTFECDYNATKLTSGVYLCKLSSDNYVETRKMILIK